MSVCAIVEHLEAAGVHVHCLALGGTDLTKSTEKMTIQVINDVVEFARDLPITKKSQNHSGKSRQGIRVRYRYNNASPNSRYP